MRVYCYPADDQGCGLHRIIWPALTLRGRGFDVRTVMPNERTKFLEGRLNARGELVDVVIPPDADVIVMQRVTHRHLADAIPLIRQRGVAVVIDMDDDLAAVDPRNPAFAMMHPRNVKTPDHSWQHTQRACEAATLVTTSTPELVRRYAPHGRGRVLYNCIPQRYLRMERIDSDVVGWAGSVHSHPDDLQQVGNAIALLTDESRPFQMIGPPEGARQALGLSYDPPGTGPLDPQVGWPKGVNTLGVGIAPLADTRFNRSKCLDYDTRIVTQRGLVRVGEVTTDDSVWYEGVWRRVLATEHSPEQQGVAVVTTQGRSIALTDNHRLMSDGEWKLASELAVGDTLDYTTETWPQCGYQRVPWPAESRQTSQRWKRDSDDFNDRSFYGAVNGPHVEINETWGRILGLFTGDGHGTPTGISIAFDRQDQDVIDQAVSDFRSVGLRPMFHGDKRYDGERYRGCGVNVSSAHLARFMELIGVIERKDDADIRHGVRRTLRIPEVIWQSPRSVAAAFLAGLFEADGSGDRSIVLTTKSEWLARDIQRALLGFGIISTIGAFQITKPVEYAGRWYWSIKIDKRAADIFAREIGFLGKRKRDKMESVRAFVPGSHGSGRTLQYADEISSIERCMVRPVDIQVEGEVFAAVSFVSHNSWLKPLEYAALGVPCVMSPRVEYRRIHALGVGLLADKPKHWLRLLRELRESADLRAELSEKGRAVAANWTVEGNAERWWQAWEYAAKLEETGTKLGR